MKRIDVIYKNAELGDIDKLVKLEISVWGEEMAADKEKWLSRIKIFPKGINIAISANEIVGAVVSHIINWNYINGNFPTWEEVTNNGYIMNHDINGNVMYGVNISVLSGYPNVAENLITINLKIAREKGIRTIFGCRIPSLYERLDTNVGLSDTKLLHEYALRDPEVKFFMMKFGFRIVGFKRNYFEIDTQSLGWGVILELQ